VTHAEHISLFKKIPKEAIRYYETVLKLTCCCIEAVAEQNIKPGSSKTKEKKLKLREPTLPDTTVTKILEKRMAFCITIPGYAGSRRASRA